MGGRGAKFTVLDFLIICGLVILLKLTPVTLKIFSSYSALLVYNITASGYTVT